MPATAATTREQAKSQSDLYQIIAYYNDAIRRDPRDDDAYFHRGLAKLYAGALPAAIADLAQASKLDPNTHTTRCGRHHRPAAQRGERPCAGGRAGP